MNLCYSIEMPQTEDCLRMFASVARDPFDATARLVLADAIQESGDQLLAQFVRVYTNSAGEGLDGPRLRCERVARMLGAPVMAGEVKSKATGKALSECGMFSYSLVDGFPSVLRITPGALSHENMGAWARHVPLTHVVMSGVSPVEVDYPGAVGRRYGLSGVIKWSKSAPVVLKICCELRRIHQDDGGGETISWPTKVAAKRAASRAAVNMLRVAAGYPRLYTNGTRVS